MKRVLIFLYIFLFIITFSIDNLKCQGVCGIYAYDIKNERVILSSNATNLFVPASVTKLFTLLGALEVLKEDFVYETKFYYFDGSLGIKTSGDPTIYPSLLSSIVERLIKEYNIKTVKYVIIDDRLFDRKEFFGRGWMWDDANPIISAAFLKLPKGSYFSKIDQYTAVKNFYRIIENTLKDNGITVSNGLKLKYISTKKYNPIYVHKSSKLFDILVDMIQASDNQTAEQIFRTIGAVFKRKGNTQNSMAAIIKVVKESTGYGINDFRIVDGSGLSRYNLVSPEIVVKILVYMYKKYGEKLFDILSYSKGKGTLASRFSFDFWGKTGTLTGVSGLAGFLKTKNGNLIALSIFENNFIEAKFNPKEYENQIVTYLYENY